MPHQVLILLAAGGLMFLVIGCLAALSHYYTLSGIKSKTVGDGQHGTARWATAKEIRQTYAHVPFEVKKWRSGQNLPTEQGLVLGCKGKKGELTALVDSDDIHCLMIGASGIGKTAYFLYPNLEYACASGMSWLALDSKGDLARNYGAIAKNCYGYQNVAVIDLRNPTRSDGNNLLTLVNRYMDIARSDPNNLAARAKAEKYAKILSKTIVNPDGDDSNRGQNAFFYDAAEGLLTSVILMLAEFLPPDKDHPQERRHIVSVFKLVQDLLEPSRVKGKSHFQLLMAKLPPDHKARWFAGAALNSAEQAMASVMSTVLSRLNAFLDSELEQILCFDSAIDAEKFASEKSAIFLILPEEDTTKNFMAGLMIQNLSRELFAAVQKALDQAAQQAKDREIHSWSPNLLRGKIFCAHCGRSLHRQKCVRRKSQEVYVYHCISNNRIKKGVCPGAFIFEKELLDALADMIQEQLDTTLGQYSLGLENLSKEAEEQKNIQAKIASRKQEIQQLRTYQRGLYEGLIQNHLSKDEYFTFKEKYEAKIEAISKEIEQLKAGLEIIAKQLEQYKMLSQDAQHIKEDRQLTAALIDRLIDRVEVSREKRITVRFRFQSEFEHCEEVLSQCRNM